MGAASRALGPVIDFLIFSADAFGLRRRSPDFRPSILSISFIHFP